MMAKWVKVEPKRSCEQSWVLWDHSYSFSQLLELQLFNVNSINFNCAFMDFNDSANSQTDGALASTCSTNYSDFFLWVNFK